MASTDARPIPRKNTAFRAYLNILDADGDPVTGAASLDSEVSIDGAAFADCTAEATEIGSTGMYYLDLTAAEMNGDGVCVQVKTATSGAKTTQLVFYPEEAGDVRVDVVQISGDSTAADNLETATDGGAYNIGGGSVVAASVTGAVGSVTGNVGGNVAGSVASVTASVTLADDAITASKFDESTAFPMTAAYTAPLNAAGTRTAVGLASANLDTQLAAIAGSSGSGANVVTVTVTDDDENPLQNATVRMTEGANSFTATTNVSGVATFALDNATYTLAITKAGYSFTPASRVVDGAEALEEEMTQVAITPASDPTQTNAYLRTYDAHGAAEATVTIEFQLLHASGEAGRSFPGKVFTAVSDAQGDLEVDLLRSSRYQARRNHETGTGTWVPFTTGGSSTHQLPEVLGAAS